MVKYISYERRGFTGILLINRPQALNALNSEVINELSQTLDDISPGASAADLRCLIISGAGERSFVAGADIGEMSKLSPEEAEEFCNTSNRAMEKIENFPVPVIAAINGYALGGGFELALACDIRIASETAVFALPEVSLGILPGSGGIQRLVRLIGQGRAKELLFSTRRITSAEALSWGVVNSVYPSPELMGEALKLAEKISGNAPRAVRGTKKAANDSVGLTLEKSTRLEAALFKDCFARSDQQKAMAAFLEKRKPEPFTGT
ncbi:enoyl-CoA hydratase [Spirochaetia bacterium]|nr:enoyl-CoA hydratase [Spirochaetia bacterium]